MAADLRGCAAACAVALVLACAHEGVSPSEFYPFDGEVHRGPRASKSCTAALAARADAPGLKEMLAVNSEGRVSQRGSGPLAQLLAECRLEPATIGGRSVVSAGEAAVERAPDGAAYLSFSATKVGEIDLPHGKCAAPEYPEAARAKGVEGCVRMAVGVDPTGRLHSARILEAPSPELGEASIAKIASCRMEPARRRGRPVAVRIEYSYCFLLD